jgi:predicted O-methyltransferase YrrM
MGGSLVARGVSFGKSYVTGLASAAYLFTAGIGSPRARGVMQGLPRLLGFGPQPRPPQLPRLALDAVLFPGALEIREPLAQDGNVTLLELAVLASLVRRRSPEKIFEIGTFDGRTALNLAANARTAIVHTLDLPPQQATAFSVKTGDEVYINKTESGSRFRGTDCADRIAQHYGDSATFNFEPYWGQMDFVFVDGAHSEDYVKADSLTALKLLRPGSGVIVWHDYGTTQVTEAIDQLWRSDPRFSEMKHVDQTALAVLISPARVDQP